MLEKDPKNRPTAEELLNYDIIRLYLSGIHT